MADGAEESPDVDEMEGAVADDEVAAVEDAPPVLAAPPFVGAAGAAAHAADDLAMVAVVDGDAGLWAAAAAIGDPAADSLADLNTRRKDLVVERRRVATAIKNQEKKRQRIVERARGLSDDTLIAIVASRACAKVKAAAKAKAKPKAKACAKVAAAPP
jgi:hypothetical protein